MFSFFLVSFPFFALAQKTATDVLNAEKSFAAYSVANGIKAAFLKFADSNGVVFERGKAVNAIQTWNKREAGAGVLNWHPVYGWVAASGELGFTTGPWTFQPKTTNDSVVARGQYNTVWRKTTGGEWKFLLDMGISGTPDFGTMKFTFDDEKLLFTPGTLNEMLKAEEWLIQQAKEVSERCKSYAAALSKHAFLLNRNSRLPTTKTSELDSLVAAMPTVVAYNQLGSGISTSGDLGYVYGTITIYDKDANYLHIWRREGKEWKLVLEVLP